MLLMGEQEREIRRYARTAALVGAFAVLGTSIRVVNGSQHERHPGHADSGR